METLPEKIADRIVNGKGHFKTTAAALNAGDCHGGIMDHQIGATNVEIMFRFSGRWPGTHVEQLFRPAGVMISHITGLLRRFVDVMEAKEGQDVGEYEVVVGVCTCCIVIYLVYLTNIF